MLVGEALEPGDGVRDSVTACTEDGKDDARVPERTCKVTFYLA